MTAKPVPEHISDDLTALERLRLHVHDHETFPFSPEDAEEILEEYEVALTELQHRREAEASGVSNALLNAVAHAIEGAYVRGVEWCEENPNGGSYRFKAGSDYADKAFHDPDSELCKALAASPSYPASGVRVKA